MQLEDGSHVFGGRIATYRLRPDGSRSVIAMLDAAAAAVAVSRRAHVSISTHGTVFRGTLDGLADATAAPEPFLDVVGNDGGFVAVGRSGRGFVLAAGASSWSPVVGVEHLVDVAELDGDLVAVALPERFFAIDPSGSVRAMVASDPLRARLAARPDTPLRGTCWAPGAKPPLSDDDPVGCPSRSPPEACEIVASSRRWAVHRCGVGVFARLQLTTDDGHSYAPTPPAVAHVEPRARPAR